MSIGDDLPRRGRSHVLESVSERAFAWAMPEQWIETKPDKDYGIDRHIEVFELDPGNPGSAVPTGFDFGVQYKATDDETARAMSVGIRWSTLHYWWLKPYPVLVVRYRADTDSLYGRWAHNRPNDVENGLQAQAWFHFDDRHLLTNGGDCWDALVEDVRSFRDARERSVELPLELSLIGDRCQSSTAARINAELRARMNGDEVLIVPDRTTEPRFTVDDHRSGASLGGPIGVYFYGEQPDPADAATLLLSLALCFGRMGRWTEALRILRNCRDAAPLNDPEWLTLAATLSATGGDAGLGIDLLEDFAQAHGVHGQLAAALARVVHEATHPSDNTDRLISIADRWIEATPDGDDRSTMCFNMATICSTVGAFTSAVRLFDRCLHESDRYLGRGYYWIGTARALLSVGETGRAAQAYEQAATLSGDPLLLAEEHAEAALFSGHYADARQLIDDVVAKRGDPTVAEHLLMIVCSSVIALSDSREQSRDTAAALQRWSDTGSDRGDSRYDITSILDLDGLFAPAWEWMTQHMRELPTHPDTALVAAITARDDAVAWASALVAAQAWNWHDEVMLEMIARGRACDHRFDRMAVRTIDELLATSTDGYMTGAKAENLFRLLATHVPTERPFFMRSADDGEWLGDFAGSTTVRPERADGE
ncbi:MAG: DUF4365 domain-containing protein [Ilumatobacteraceae bacterium]|nr:DUF4365 domain-containing protein [Ilumatobacteraceae bacterium]